MTVTVTGRITETIEDGAYINVNAKLDLTTVLKKTYQLCDLDGVDCPLAPGDVEINISFSLDTATAVRIFPYSTCSFGEDLTPFRSTGKVQSQHPCFQLRREGFELHRWLCDCSLEMGGKYITCLDSLGISYLSIKGDLQIHW